MQPVNSETAIASQPESSSIAGVTEPSLMRYFETFNAGDFEATSQQFAIAGVLNPPFEAAIEGRDAIADYLNVAASGITAQPRQTVSKQVMEEGGAEIDVRGRVQTQRFSVNVAWLFKLNSQQEITVLKVKLIASPQELLNLGHS